MIAIIGAEMAVLKVNGYNHRIAVRPCERLLDTLRITLGLTGAKPGCENGDCGACTVIVDGLPIKACLMLSAEAIGHEIITIEGLYNAPEQKAFIEKKAFQCGYCTSGFIMALHALSLKHKNPTDAQIDHWLESNICRCTSYQEIGEAARAVLYSTD